MVPFSLPPRFVCYGEWRVDFDYLFPIDCKKVTMSWVLEYHCTTLDKTKQVIDKLMVFTSNETKARGKAMS